MPISLRLSLLLALLLVGPLISKGEDSLYDPRTARKLSPEQQWMFGPQSGKFRYDGRMLHAAEIAAERAHMHSTYRCWRYVKTALMAANAVDSYPKTQYAKQAGNELQQSYGFRRIKIEDPYKAPIGAVLVYGGRGPGHVEIRTAAGFASDFTSVKPSTRPLLGVYVKPKA